MTFLQWLSDNFIVVFILSGMAMVFSIVVITMILSFLSDVLGRKKEKKEELE